VDDHAPSQPSVAETLPDTYRLVLDRIADLETAGFRREADLVRSDAITAYSRRWNEGTARRLERLATRADRVRAATAPGCGPEVRDRGHPLASFSRSGPSGDPPDIAG
jgi:hypothetical protein